MLWKFFWLKYMLQCCLLFLLTPLLSVLQAGNHINKICCRWKNFDSKLQCFSGLKYSFWTLIQVKLRMVRFISYRFASECSSGHSGEITLQDTQTEQLRSWHPWLQVIVADDMKIQYWLFFLRLERKKL